MSGKLNYREAIELLRDPNTTEYTCVTGDCEEQGGVVVSINDRTHGHGCPDEGDICTAALCNMLGRCDA